MKIYIVSLLVIFLSCNCYAQIVDYKIKSNFNQQERTKILNLIRKRLLLDEPTIRKYSPNPKFKVENLLLSNNYAWFSGIILDEKNNPIRPKEFEHDDINNFAGYANALLKRKNNKWVIIEAYFFPSNPWWENLKSSYPDIPCEIFGKLPWGWVNECQ